MSETNYSSARQSGIEDDLTYDEEKELLFQVLDEIYGNLCNILLAERNYFRKRYLE